MKNIHQWLEEYGASHQNPTNKLIHWICVPLIFFSITGLLFCIKLPITILGIPLNVAILMLIAVVIYYFMLSRTLWIGMLFFALVCVLVSHFIEQSGFSLSVVCVAVFILAWIGQFYGHHVEGKKPSFIHDLQFLLIGPAWLMSFIYKKIGLPL